MQDMHLRVRLTRQTNEPFGRTQSRHLVAPDRVRRGIAGDAQGFSLIQARLILAVERCTAAYRLQDREHALIVGDQ